MDDSKRLSEVMKYLGFSPIGEQSRFARTIKNKKGEDYSVDTINKILHGKLKISKNLAKSIIEKYPTINLYWLLTGQGKMEINSESQISDKFRDISFVNENSRYIEQRTYMDLLNENYNLKKYEAENIILKKLIEKLEDQIDVLTKSKEISKLDTQAIANELEEKFEEILTGTVNRNFEKLNNRIEETEEKLLKNISSK